MGTDTAAGWAARATVLANWALKHLINRDDAWGRYIPKPACIKDSITRDLLVQHFKGETTIGLYTTSIDQTCRWCVWDFDNHDDDPDTAKSNHNRAIALADQLTKRGMFPLIESSDGRGSFHLWIVFDHPVPVDALYR
ncbi:hypothetical protein LCGC14_1906410, partial [marine sediment metagenome]